MAIRVYQVAKEYSRSPEEIISLLQSAGIKVDSQTSKLDEHALHTLRAKLGKFKLTVVDGDQEERVGGEKTAAKPKVQKKKKAKKEEPPKPRLAVRVIKKHDEPEKENEEAESAPEEPKKKVLKPKLRKPNARLAKIEQRISKLAEKSPDAPDEAPKAEKPAEKAAETPAPKREESPAAAGPASTEKPKAAPTQQRSPRLPPQESRPPVRDGYQQNDRRPGQGGDRRPGQGGGYRQGGQGQGGGYRQGGQGGGYRQGGQGGGYRQGGQGGQGGGYRQGGQGGGYRQGGPGGGGRPGGQGGGYRQGGQGGGYRQGGPGGGRPGGQGGGYRQGGGGRPGGPGGRPGGPGGRPGGQGGGYRGGRGGGPGGPGALPVKTPEQAAAKSGTNRQNRFAVNRPSSRKKKRKKKNQENIAKMRHAAHAPSKVELPTEDLGIIMLSEGATVKELAEKVNRMAKDVIKRLFEKGVMATLNDVLDSELAIDLAKDFGYLAEIVSFEEDLQYQEEENITELEAEETSGKTEPRAPIVTIMGHVDHGKTTLLDAIRTSKVASGEAGGITQHIGAYSVETKGKSIVFLDTPGHEAFTKMRARGASVTDIVILVVAADDGVKPQTIEAINHAKAAKVPIITCINKIDKPEANPERVKQMLTEHDLIVEDFGGDSPSVTVSAKQMMGIDDLLDMILLVADLNEYKASPERRARGTVIEAKLDRGRGPVATVIVQDGTLKIGDYFITGQTNGRIRAMHDEHGRDLLEAGPSTPVEILGLNDVPAAGDNFLETEDEATARKIASFRKERAREEHLHRNKHTSLDQLFKSLDKDEVKELPIIIKADVHGSVEGILFALNKIKSEKVTLRVVHQGVGNITENDVLLAVAADAIVIGFNVKSEGKAQALAEQEGIEVRPYSIIYEVVKDIETAMLGLVAPTLEEREIGRATILQIFSVARLGKVAGCKVDSGIIKRNAKVRVFRGTDQLHEGELQTLKRFKDDVNEVKAGFECGIGIKSFNDIEEGDELVFHVMEEVEATEL